MFALAIAAYALSPIDLIPDFIPVIGYLDEVILLPLAIMLAVRLVPPDLMAEHRATAAKAEGKPISRAGAAFVVAVWFLAAGALIWLSDMAARAHPSWTVFRRPAGRRRRRRAAHAPAP